MLNIDPAKLLIIAVVAVILLGPDRLPQFARQVGSMWRTFNEYRHRVETEVRESMPDLPSTADITRLARSPSALLNHLSTLSSNEDNAPAGASPPNPVIDPVVTTDPVVTINPVVTQDKAMARLEPVAAGDPGMN